ncbi:MAG: hypothetical protein DRI56_10555, partial [Chloroflexota bacterium]
EILREKRSQNDTSLNICGKGVNNYFEVDMELIPSLYAIALETGWVDVGDHTLDYHATHPTTKLN